MVNAQIERVKHFWSTINDRLIRSSDGRRPEQPSILEAVKQRFLRLTGRASTTQDLEEPEIREAPPLELEPEEELEPGEPGIPTEPSPKRALDLAAIKGKLLRVWSALRTISQSLGTPPTVALSFEDGLIRVVVLQGRQVVAWSLVQPWAPPVSQSEDEESQEGSEEESPPNEEGAESPGNGEAACIRALLDGLRIRKCRTVTDVPLYASLLRHLTLPIIPGTYLEEVVINEVVETIPFAADEVDISWDVKGVEDDQQKVFAIAVPKDVIEEHVRMMDAAGARPVATYSKAAALAASAGSPDVISLHVTTAHAAAVLVQGGLPQVVNQVTLPSADGDIQAQAEAVVGAVEQMAGYYEDFRATGDSPSLPVVVTGQLSDQALLIDVVQMLMQRDRLDAQIPLDYPDDFSPNEYAINLGLILALQSGPKGTIFNPKDTSNNLLPKRYLPRVLPALAIAVFGVLFVLGAGALLATFEVKAIEETEEGLVKNSDRQQRLSRLSLGRAVFLDNEFRGIRESRDELTSTNDSLRHELDDLLDRVYTISVSALPDGVVVPYLDPGANELQVAGTALTYRDVDKYASNLRDSGLFFAVEVRNVSVSGTTVGESEDRTEGEEPIKFRLNIIVENPVAEEDVEGSP